MGTIEIVVKIPKKCKEFLDNGGKIDWLDAIPIIDAIANGIVLPKGHGELIDGSKLGLTDFEIVMCDGDYRKGLEMLCNKIENAKVLIEADREEEND